MTRNTSKAAVAKETPSAAARLLAWYDGHRRALPWRALPGQHADPYAVWLSEVMLQQTTVAAVKAYYVSFLGAWPTVGDLAAAPVDEVMKRWAGLGYYSRARNLHACAQAVVAAHGGRFPGTEAALRTLPGIGAYTAAAVAAIAFDQRAVVIDGNVDRVIVRLNGIDTPIALAKPEIRRLADAQTPDARPGDYAQAMMDLGATICTPRKPACVICPLAEACVARITGRQDILPVKGVKAARPVRHGSVFYVRRASGEVLVRTRPPKGLLGGMTEFPGSAWDAAGDPDGAARPLAASYQRLIAPVEHGFTHFELVLTPFLATVAAKTPAPDGCRWISEAGLAGEALPSLMRKVAAAAEM
jgi:A/G-specific adenine glycosylase